MDIEIRVPDFEQTDDPPVAVQWLVDVGGKVEHSGDVLEIETCKAVFAIESPAAGTIRTQLVQKGDAVQPGQVVGVLTAAE
jgi:pyruvate/2-oxoglutarate dehydrogenase complex dihydrolipoamide acyltransferase (E2) component